MYRCSDNFTGFVVALRKTLRYGFIVQIEFTKIYADKSEMYKTNIVIPLLLRQ